MKNKQNKILGLAIILFIFILIILLIHYITTPKPGNLTQITYKEVEKKLNNKEDFILVISKTTCSHCATYKPKLKTITKEYGIDIYYLDYDTESEDNQTKLFETLNLTKATPITLFIKDGKETSLLNRIEGDLSKNTVIKKCKKLGFIH